VSDHMHEPYDVYGLDGTRQAAREALTLANGLPEDLGRAEERIHDLEGKLAALEKRVRELEAARQAAAHALHQAGVGIWAELAPALERIDALEAQTPQARQLQHEADVAAADLAASGYGQDPPIGADRHGPGCLCPYCPGDEPEPEDYDPGPEVDDEGGMSEYRYLTTPEETP
jgi:hypothetical protein